MAIQYELEFADAQNMAGNNTTVIGSSVNYMSMANNHKSGWHTITHNNVTQAEIGGMVWCVDVNNNVAGGNLTVALKTAATNNLNATGTVIASVSINNGTAAGTRYAVKLPAGTKRQEMLGVINTNAGNVSAANLSSFLKPGAGTETPSK